MVNPMTIITKYGNRKYWDKSGKAYTTLANIAAMKPGSYVVFDHKTRNNITEAVFFEGLMLRARNVTVRATLAARLSSLLDKVGA